MKSKIFIAAVLLLVLMVFIGCEEDEDDDKDKIALTSVYISITLPETGNTPVTTASGQVGYTVSTVTWSPNPPQFEADTGYTATVTLTANDNVTFRDLTTARFNNSINAIISNNTKATVTLSATLWTLPPEFDLNPTVVLYEKWQFPVGAAVPGANTNNGGPSADRNALLSTSAQYQFLSQFNVYAAENEMKPQNILPNSKPDNYSAVTWDNAGYKWTNAETLVDYAKANGKKVRFHTLIWHDQTPNWFTSGTGTSGRATKVQLYENMENHIRIVFEWIKAKGYEDTILWFDVVNEAVAQDTSGPRPLDEGGRYTQIMIDSGLTGNNRYEYIIKAFEWARYYADINGCENAELYLTDFGVERPFTRNGTTKMADFKALANYLITNNAPIDGVGFQGHFRLYDHPVSTTSATANNDNRIPIEPGIEEFAGIEIKPGKKLKVQICEMDISIFSNFKNEGSAQTIASNLLGERLRDLAATYREFFEMFERQYEKGNLDMVVIWGLADGQSWLNSHPVSGRTDYPLLFSRNYKAKEAYIKLIEDRD